MPYQVTTRLCGSFFVLQCFTVHPLILSNTAIEATIIMIFLTFHESSLNSYRLFSKTGNWIKSYSVMIALIVWKQAITLHELLKHELMISLLLIIKSLN